ncbi:MAG: PLP-dependent transferase [Anaerolineae bacterium]|nr:PLP-dependent transferase [Anaerolineae bacterium]
MTIDAMPFCIAEQKRRIREWIGEGIVRASIGLESADDLIRHLDQALRAHTFKGWVGPTAYHILKKAEKINVNIHKMRKLASCSIDLSMVN